VSTGHKGYYSLIQYCPDRSRMESANVGVVLFCPDLGFLEVKLAAGHDRLRRFFHRGSFAPEAIRAAKRAIANRFKVDRAAFGTLEDLDRFIATRANALGMTPARPMNVVDAARELEGLFTELVGGRVRSDRDSEPRLALDAVFRQPDLQGRIHFNHVVRVPVIGREFRAPYSYRNGVLNLVKPQEFPANEASATATAMKLAVEGDLLWKHGQETGERAKLIVVPAFALSGDVSADLPRRILELFENYDVRTVGLDRIESFAEEVRQTAH